MSNQTIMPTQEQEDAVYRAVSAYRDALHADMRVALFAGQKEVLETQRETSEILRQVLVLLNPTEQARADSYL